MEGLEFIVLLAVLLCGGLVLGTVIVLWVIYLKTGKPSKRVRYIGTGILVTIVFATVSCLVVLVGAGGLLVIPGLLKETRDTDFYNAACRGDTEQVERLIKSGTDINFVEENRKCTALLGATYGNHTSTVEALLRHHPADLNQRSIDGKTALQEAKENHNVDIVRLLKAAGAKE